MTYPFASPLPASRDLRVWESGRGETEKLRVGKIDASLPLYDRAMLWEYAIIPDGP